MPVSYQCPGCGTSGVAEDQFAGQSGSCAACGAPLTIPSTTGPAAKKGNGLWIVLGILGFSSLALVVCCGALFYAVVAPAREAAMKAAERNNCAANLRQLSMAMHIHHDAFKKFPPAVYQVDGEEARHSWRARLLPFMEETQLFDQIDFEESWDSPANGHVYDRIIPLYRCPSATDAEHNTNYLAIVGNESAFRDDGGSTSMASMADGTSKTILFVEGHDTNIHWFEPRDFDEDQLDFRVKRGPQGPDSQHNGIVMSAFADGSVHSINEDIDPEVLKALTTRRGGDGDVIQHFFDY